LLQELVYNEFFSQGDLEKAMGTAPLEMMDREKARIPELQIQFLSHIVIPVFRYTPFFFFFLSHTERLLQTAHFFCSVKEFAAKCVTLNIQGVSSPVNFLGQVGALSSRQTK